MARKKTDDRMTVIEHLTELRRRIMISLAAVGATAVVAYIFAPDVIRWLLEYYTDAAPKGTDNHFIFTGPLDGFITPGLNPKEKRYAVPFITTSIALFLAGGVVALITLPQALHFLLTAGGQELQPLLAADKFISLVTLMILAFGLAFEFPVVLVFLLIARVLSTARLSKWRRWAIVLIFAFAAVITPSQDPYSLFFMALPMVAFYEASILIGKVMKR